MDGVDCPGCGVPVGALHQPGCLQKVVDDHLLMERKAAAWDKTVAHCRQWSEMNSKWVLEEHERVVHSAQTPSSS